jgi:acetylornithine deacetylase
MTNTTDLLAALVGFRTISRDANEQAIAFIAQKLAEYGGRIRIMPGEIARKSNLLASFGPEAGDGIILSGHSDVVPVDGQSWASDPFILSERDGRLHGRGAVDMKGFIASAMNLAANLPVLQRPLHIAISHDEEIGCVGVRSMLRTLAQEKFVASGCIIGEPTGLCVAIGQKGKFAGCVRCQGEAAHSANPDLGCNAIYLAAGMIAELRDLQDWLRAHGAHDAAYALPYSSVHVGTIDGGSALNIVPEFCEMKFEIRFLPGDDPAALIARLRAAGQRLAGHEIAKGRFAAIEIKEDNIYPGLDASPQSPFVETVCAAAGDQAVTKLDFGSEAGLFHGMLNLPAVVCGPGSIARAHRPDEYITKAELAACDLFLARLATSLS